MNSASNSALHRHHISASPMSLMTVSICSTQPFWTWIRTRQRQFLAYLTVMEVRVRGLICSFCTRSRTCDFTRRFGGYPKLHSAFLMHLKLYVPSDPEYHFCSMDRSRHVSQFKSLRTSWFLCRKSGVKILCKTLTQRGHKVRSLCQWWLGRKSRIFFSSVSNIICFLLLSFKSNFFFWFVLFGDESDLGFSNSVVSFLQILEFSCGSCCWQFVRSS